MRKLVLLASLIAAAVIAPSAAMAQIGGYPPPSTTTTTRPTTTSTTTGSTTSTTTGGTTSTTTGGTTSTTTSGATTTTTRPATTTTLAATTTTLGPNSDLINIGIVITGGTIEADACGFVPNSVVNISINGISLGSGTTTIQGCIHIVITVPGGGSALGRPLLAVIGLHLHQLAQSGIPIKVNGADVMAKPYGQTNSLVVTGEAAGRFTTRTVTLLFTINDPNGSGGGVSGGTSSGGGVSGGTSSGGMGSASSGDSSSSSNGFANSGFARTGFNFLRLVLLAGALIAIGRYMVLRRRVAARG